MARPSRINREKKKKKEKEYTVKEREREREGLHTSQPSRLGFAWRLTPRWRLGKASNHTATHNHHNHGAHLDLANSIFFCRSRCS